MFISHKANVLQTFHETEWQCRRLVKGLNKSEYLTWIDTITTQDENGFNVITYPSEDFTIVECIDENIKARLAQLNDYISMDGSYNIKYYVTKRDSEIEGVQSHFIGQDDTRDARILAEKWERIRTRRNRELTESDWVVVKAKEEHINASIDSNWMEYRTALRDITKQSDPDNITWPTKP